QLDRPLPAPDFMYDHVVELARRELAHRVARAVDGGNDLEIDVRPEPERIEVLARGGLLLVRHRRGDDVDAVPAQPPDQQVALRPELDLAELLGLAVDLAARG